MKRTLPAVLLVTALAAQPQTDRMTSPRFVIERSAFAVAGGSAQSGQAEARVLTDRFGAPHFHRMESSRFRIGTGVTLQKDAEVTLPVATRFLPNYPNPFNSRTCFTIELAQEDDVHVAVYSLRGRQLAVLFEGRLEAGRFDLHFDGTDEEGVLLPSGVYFVRMTTKRFDGTLKIAILR